MSGISVLGIMGSNPINSATTWVTKSFVSLLRGRASNAFADSPKLRGYVTTRGFLISKQELQRVDSEDLWKSGYMFQFNPAQIQDIKSTSYETRPYAGLPYVDYIWSGGGERVISFQLILDDTPQSHTKTFRPETFGSHLAQSIKTNTSESGTHKAFSKQGISNELKNIGSQMGITLSKAPTKFDWDDNGAYSTTRIHERGTLGAVEKITQYLYPALGRKRNATSMMPIPHFSTGGIVEVEQFRPPAIVVFSFGNNYYLEGIIKSANTSHTLFDADLTPIRTTVDIEFGVIDTAKVEQTQIQYPQSSDR